ncbi:MAG: c-type cytochrome [Trueperaceae bacterium]
MRRAIVVGIVAVLLGVALVQESQGAGASLEVSTDPPESLVNITGPKGFMSMLDVSGSETLTGLPAGRYLLVATADGHAVARAEVELGEGDSETVSLQLEPLDGGERANQPAAQSAEGSAEGQTQQDGQQQDGVAGGGQAQGAEDGEQVYQQQCAQCHGQEGEGGTGPALAGNENLQDAQTVVGQILQGGGGMPAFAGQLSDEEVAAVATHEMNSWGNDFGEVTPDDVAQQVNGGQGNGGQGNGGQAQDGGQEDEQSDQEAQQGEQRDGQPQDQPQADVQVDQDGQMARVEIEIPAGTPVTLNLQLEIAGAQDEMGAMGEQPDGGQGQPEGDGQAQDQQAQDQQQSGQQAQQQNGEQDQEAGGQDQQQVGQQQAQDDVQQGVLQIKWVEPAGATVTVTGPDGYSEQLQVIGGEVLGGLTPGTYTITGTLAGYESAGEEVEVEAQETAEVSLTLQQQPGQQQPELGEPNGQQAQEGQQQQQDSEQTQQQDGEQQEGEQQEGAADGAQAQQGEQIYSRQCAQCHGQEGEGGTGPALAGNQAMQDAQAVVTQILEGGAGMPAFGNQLSDEEVAAVATHEMNSWGNEFGEVTPDDVAQQRDGGQAQDGGQEGQQQEGQQAQQDQQQANWFTSQQARSGMEEYTSHCAVCHGGGLQGRASYPPVAGEDFLGVWQGRSAEELFEYISTEMPQDRPGALGHLTYTNITAYILDQNGIAAGDTELEPESGRLAQFILPAPEGDGGQQQEGDTPAPVGQETQQQPEQEDQ